MKLTESRWVHVIWCDDIRQEVGNKSSLMGVYSNGLVVPSLPTMLPRLAAWIHVHTPTAQPFETLNLRINRSDSDEPVASIQITEMPPVPSFPDSQNMADKAMTMGFVLLLGPLVLNETTNWFKVFVETESEILESFKLSIRTTATDVALAASAGLQAY